MQPTRLSNVVLPLPEGPTIMAKRLGGTGEADARRAR